MSLYFLKRPTFSRPEKVTYLNIKIYMNRLLPPFSYRTTEPENDGGYVPDQSEMAEQDDTDLVVEVEEANIYSTPLGQNANSPRDRKVKTLRQKTQEIERAARSKSAVSSMLRLESDIISLKECRELNVTFRKRHNPPRLRTVAALAQPVPPSRG